MAKSKARTTSTKKKNIALDEEKIEETIEQPNMTVEETPKNKYDPEVLIKTSFLVFFTSNKEAKLMSIKKYMTIKEMIAYFIRTPNCFVGLNSNRDLKMIKDSIYNLELALDHIVISNIVKEKFIGWITDNSKFVSSRLKK